MATIAETNEAMEEGIFYNSRGRRLCTYAGIPKGKPCRAIIVLAHGYAHYGLGFARHFIKFPERGVAVFAMDHEGHGYSDGIKAYIEDYKHLVGDFAHYVQCIAAKYPGIPIFAVGESMGGAIVMTSTFEGGLLHEIVRGAVLVAPMCKIADNLRPPEWQIALLKSLANFGPTWPIVPVPNVLSLCFRNPEMFEIARRDPLVYHGKPRLKTAMELFHTSLAIADTLHNVTVPFLVVHGGADRVTDPAFSRELHQRAASKDKTFKLYDGMYHAVFDEPDNAGQMVLDDIYDWIMARV